MANVWGGQNTTADPILSWSRRPIYRRPDTGKASSPMVGDGKCRNPDGSERHYCGAFSPMGDWNGNGRLDDAGEDVLSAKKTGAGVCSTDPAARSLFDFDGDCDIDTDDHLAFLEGYVGNAPNIPAASTWGLVSLGLVTLIGGTLVLRRRASRVA